VSVFAVSVFAVWGLVKLLEKGVQICVASASHRTILYDFNHLKRADLGIVLIVETVHARYTGIDVCECVTKTYTVGRVLDLTSATKRNTPRMLLCHPHYQLCRHCRFS